MPSANNRRAARLVKKASAIARTKKHRFDVACYLIHSIQQRIDVCFRQLREAENRFIQAYASLDLPNNERKDVRPVFERITSDVDEMLIDLIDLDGFLRPNRWIPNFQMLQATLQYNRVNRMIKSLNRCFK
jgi:hypothetical protein